MEALLQIFLSFLVSIIAGIISNFLFFWIQKNKKKDFSLNKNLIKWKKEIKNINSKNTLPKSIKEIENNNFNFEKIKLSNNLFLFQKIYKNKEKDELKYFYYLLFIFISNNKNNDF
ncbi:MAG: hypothetical protein HPAVJP_0110 [Candidatus Hepatoplasma vulgare]|nr:MAG: hypothetical protein HPAVJP_0110 [Candidatus Hepatoplasma sp.]